MKIKLVQSSENAILQNNEQQNSEQTKNISNSISTSNMDQAVLQSEIVHEIPCLENAVADVMAMVELQQNVTCDFEECMKIGKEVKEELNISVNQCSHDQIWIGKLQDAITAKFSNFGQRVNSLFWDSFETEKWDVQKIKQVISEGQNHPVLIQQCFNIDICDLLDIQQLPIQAIYEHPQLSSQKSGKDCNPKIGIWIINQLTNDDEITTNYLKQTILNMWSQPGIPQMRKCMVLQSEILMKLFPGLLTTFSDIDLWQEEDGCFWNKNIHDPTAEKQGPNPMQVFIKPISQWKKFAQNEKSDCLVEGLRLLVSCLYDPNYSTVSNEGKKVVKKIFQQEFSFKNFVAAILTQLSFLEIRSYCNENRNVIQKQPLSLNNEHLNLECEGSAKLFNNLQTKAGLILVKFLMNASKVASLADLHTWSQNFDFNWVAYRQLSKNEFLQVRKGKDIGLQLDQKKSYVIVSTVEVERNTKYRKNYQKSKRSYESELTNSDISNKYQKRTENIVSSTSEKQFNIFTPQSIQKQNIEEDDNNSEILNKIAEFLGNLQSNKK